ncbi:DUF3500 domain-containing protein [Paractinoplanes deccanensis]|uniref:DUF3500 domain-containing protein n=1 Tax=Paractinoplanes deccanensis TaxID=113561 RepID=UPI00194465B3|nr:DUF3500 domain-containing protein [Actinoplanes deccanensis]
MIRKLCVAFSATLLLVAGCGSDDDDAVETTTSSATGVAGVVAAAEAFLATLDDDQKESVELELSEANATAWSNLPCGSSCRVGIQFETLSDDQLTAAKKVLQAATGSSTGTGYDLVMQILLADDYLGSVQGTQSAGPGASGGPPGGMMSGAPPSGMSGMPSGGASGGPGGGTGSGYSSGNYFMAFLGTPSTTDAWQLHFGGHHLAVNLTYKGGAVGGASPFFVGVEPTSWEDDGTTYQPLESMRQALLKVTAGLSDTEKAKAKLGKTYTDVLVGPGEDGQFPETKEGLPVSGLTDDQKALVLAAIKPWVAIVDDTTAASLMKTYESELDQTYIGWSGTTGLTAHGDYVRIDGPSAWVEFVCQNGVVITNKIHYHTVYRDHTRDYGGEFDF